ncbi:hypothetical protein [Halarcobacter sp.]|uniref:hypothetical protein n=1 Tax=Halarcobacter sp. TaxID=2321133 RepID=UPI003A9286FC
MSDEKYSKYLPKENKSYAIANAIIESICYHNIINKHLPISTFDSTTGFYDWNDENTEILNIMENSKNILKEATRVIRALKILVSEKRKYILSTNEWFEDTKFSIHDNIVLKELSQILLYYVGNCRGMTYNDFFKKLDFLIEYVIKPAIEHNESFEKERYVIDCINSAEEVLILDEDNNEVFVVAIKIKLSRTSYNNKVEKILIYESDEDSSVQEVSIDRVVLKQKVSNKEVTSSSFNPMLSYKTFTNYEEQEKKPKKEKFVDVVIESSTTLFEYFQMLPLKSMKTYATQEELKEFHQKIEHKPKDNKFYITASDTEEMILSTVLHCLPYARILKPFELNNKLIQKFKDYGEDFIEICPSPTPNEPSSNSNDKPKKEKENNLPKNSKTQMSKEQQEKLNKEVENINKDNDKLF